MLPDRILNPGPLTYESGALPIALRGLAVNRGNQIRQICENKKKQDHDREGPTTWLSTVFIRL